jgi:hypothetical protein
MDEKHHPTQLWQQRREGERQVTKLVTWSLLLTACAAIWVAIGYSVWRFFLA